MSVLGTGSPKSNQWSQLILGVFCCIALTVRTHKQGYVIQDNWVEYLLFVLFFYVVVSNIIAIIIRVKTDKIKRGL